VDRKASLGVISVLRRHLIDGAVAQQLIDDIRAEQEPDQRPARLCSTASVVTGDAAKPGTRITQASARGRGRAAEPNPRHAKERVATSTRTIKI
jgi:hypothetical protein